MLLALFDFETTDKDTDVARVTELACCLYDTDTWRIKESMSAMLYDETYPPIDPVASALTGITDEMLKKVGCDPKAKWLEFVHLMSKANYIGGHNVRKFDIPLAHNEFKRYGLDVELFGALDSRFDIEYPSHIETRKLAYLAHELEIISTSAHSALVDVQTTAAIFKKFDINKIIERSKSPDIYIRAHVSFDNKDLAKAEKYIWDGGNKWWVKPIKECDYDKEKGNFPRTKLENYTPPK